MTKYQTIFALAEYTARNVAQSEDNWKHYLTTAARLWKDELLGQPWSKGYCIDWYGQWTSKIKSIRQYADVPAERVSLKAKLEVMKAKVAGGDTEKSMPQKTKGKEETYEIFWSFFIFIPNFIPNML